jgi:hypothetical protein
MSAEFNLTIEDPPMDIEDQQEFSTHEQTLSTQEEHRAMQEEPQTTREFINVDVYNTIKISIMSTFITLLIISLTSSIIFISTTNEDELRENVIIPFATVIFTSIGNIILYSSIAYFYFN